MDLRQPWLVAAWPGMGVVGFGAAAHLIEALGASPVVEVDPHGYFELERVQVAGGVMQKARLPRTTLHAWRDPAGARDLVVLLGEAQPQARGYEFCEEALRAARGLGVTRVVTFAAMATVMDPRAEPRVLAVMNREDEALRGELAAAGVAVLEEGEIGGLNGVLLAVAEAHGLPGVCLLGEFPYFATSLPNPKASRSVVAAFAALAGIEVDTSELASQATLVEQGLVELLERLEREADEDDEDDAEAEDEGQDEEDEDARRRIDALFERARADRGAASELKAELDRLGLFKRYEDRFLDLFKRAE